MTAEDTEMFLEVQKDYSGAWSSKERTGRRRKKEMRHEARVNGGQWCGVHKCISISFYIINYSMQPQHPTGIVYESHLEMVKTHHPKTPRCYWQILYVKKEGRGWFYCYL